MGKKKKKKCCTMIIFFPKVGDPETLRQTNYLLSIMKKNYRFTFHPFFVSTCPSVSLSVCPPGKFGSSKNFRRILPRCVIHCTFWVHSRESTLNQGWFKMCETPCIHLLSWLLNGDNIWVATRENKQSGCAPSADSDQPGHPPSLIRLFAKLLKGS